MNRRSFVAASALGGIAPFAGIDAGEAGRQSQQQYLELRTYRLPYGSSQRRFHAYMEEAALPAFERLGLGPTGVFTVTYGKNEPSLYVLLTHPSLESVVSLRARLAADETYQSKSEAFRGLPLADPGFVRVESTLLRAFAAMPTVEVPAQTREGRPRMFELRRYESHSDDAAVRKIEMFEGGGELAIFRKTGLQPVFFGETLIGPNMPNLTYMLVFDNMAARDASWSRFIADPEWAALSGQAYYADTVSAITDVILRPTGYSQI